MNKPILDLTLKHNLVLTPQLQQAIKILNMNSLELEHEITHMLTQNFILTLDSEYQLESMDDDIDEDTPEAELPLEQIDYNEWDEEYNSDWTELQHNHNESYDENNYEEYLSTTPKLSTFLVEQIEQMAISDEVTNAAKILVYQLDTDGYFRDNLNKLAQVYNISLPILERSLSIIRQCQPSGVGATDLKDCLNLQIKQLSKKTPYLSVLKRIMARHFYFIGKNPTLIQNRLQINKDEYTKAIKILHSLNPAPGYNYNDEKTQYIKPEVIVRELHGISYIESTESLRIKLTINENYAALALNANEHDKTLLMAQLQEAKWFIGALEKRADTIKKVASVVVALQQDFFQEGELAMKPLTRQKVAELLDIHESTVSRAVNGKYLLCRRGIFELRYFFSPCLSNTLGDDQSTTAIKAMIVELIGQEDSKKPLSDQKISQLLTVEGHKIARRTVAKYREELHIPPSSERRIK